MFTTFYPLAMDIISVQTSFGSFGIRHFQLVGRGVVNPKNKYHSGVFRTLEEGVLMTGCETNEAIPLSDEEIALDVAAKALCLWENHRDLLIIGKMWNGNYHDKKREHGRMILKSVEKRYIFGLLLKGEWGVRTKSNMRNYCSAKENSKLIVNEGNNFILLRKVSLINDMNIYNMKMEQFQVNTKFLNSLPPERSFAVLVFSPGDDPITYLNKAMDFLTVVASSCHTLRRGLDGIRVRRRDVPGYLKYKA
ncbi:hypothetical protein Tco_0526683 [Tanacetum coccineum]